MYLFSLLIFRLLGSVGFEEQESLHFVRKFNNFLGEKIDFVEPFDLAPLKEAIRTSTNTVFAHGKSSFYVAAELIQNVSASHGMSVASYAKCSTRCIFFHVTTGGSSTSPRGGKIIPRVRNFG